MLGWLPSLEKQVCYHIVLYSAIAAWLTSTAHDVRTISCTLADVHGEILLTLTMSLLLTVGPELPPTFKNTEWEAATKEKLIRQKSNPISGISSNQA